MKKEHLIDIDKHAKRMAELAREMIGVIDLSSQAKIANEIAQLSGTIQGTVCYYLNKDNE